jgi:hypothetical protein
MTRFLTATAALLLAGSLQAAESYQQFVRGSEADNERTFYAGVTALQPGVGATLDRYQGIGDGNPDLFSVGLGSSLKTNTGRPDIYGPFRDGNELSY